jgi:hypothetical protein
VDLDLVHPATGELEEGKEDGVNADAPDGGYVSVKRMIDDGQGGEKDATPITQLKIHKITGAQADWKTRLKFNAGGRYKIYKDEARTQLVTSEATELPANQDTILYFQGEKKSESRGGEEITMQIGINDDWHDGDSVKCTIVQSEFQVQVKAFIPYVWSEAEEIEPELLNPLNGKVVQGDLHSIPRVAANARKASQFINDYSDNTAQYFAKAPFRVMQTVVLTPYKELHDEADEQGERKTETAPSSDHYVKATGVDPTERHLEMGFKDLLAAGFDRAGKPPVTQREFRNLARGNKDASVTLEGAGKDGAMGSILGVPVL